MVSTSLADLAALLPPDLGERPRFGADERPATPHVLLVIDGGELPPGNHVIPPDGLHGVTLLDLPARWDELEDSTRLRLQFDGEAHRRRTSARCSRSGCARSRSGHAPTSARSPPPRRSPVGWRRCTRSRPGPSSRAAARSPARPTSWSCSRLGDVHSLDPEPGLAAATGPRPAAGADRARRGRLAGPPRHQGVGPAGHGPARPGRSARPAPASRSSCARWCSAWR